MKIRANYSIEPEVKREFDQICKDKSISKSAWVEQKMKDFIKENKEVVNE